MATVVLPAPQLSLSADEARLLTLRAQGFLGAGGRRGGVPAMLRRLGAVQLDTISVLARSHELVAYARLGPVPRDRIERAYWHPRQPAAFEYWSHAACILPVEEWPWYAFRRRALRARGKRWHQSHERTCAEVLARLRAEGPLNATQLGGAKAGGPWWDWSETKIAVEWLLDVGDVICVRRDGWRRVYDLPERVLPAGLLDRDPGDRECLARLAGVAARALGVVTRADLIDYHRLRELTDGQAGHAELAGESALAAGLTPVEIEVAARPGTGRRAGSTKAGSTVVPGWADPGGAGRGAARAAPGHPAVPVRLAALGSQAHQADVRLRAHPGGLRAPGQAGARLLRDAAAGRGPPGRPGRSGPPGPDPGRPAALAGLRRRRRADGPGTARGGRMGGLLRG